MIRSAGRFIPWVFDIFWALCYFLTYQVAHRQLSGAISDARNYWQVSRPPMSSSDWDLTFTWRSPDIHPTFTWHSPNHLTIIWPSPDPHHTLTQPWLGDFKLHLTFTWHSLMFTWCSPDNLTIVWPSPDPYLTIISSIQLKKSYLAVGGLVGGSTHYKPYLRV